MKAKTVVRHLIGDDPECNPWIGRSEYIKAAPQDRKAIRTEVARKVTHLLLQGNDGDLVAGAMRAESICNDFAHLMSEAKIEDAIAAPADGPAPVASMRKEDRAKQREVLIALGKAKDDEVEF